MGSLFIGLCCGITNRYLLNLILSTILALIVESYAAGNTLFYSFGDHLFKHLIIALILSSAVFGGLRLLVNLRTSKKTAVIPHALGLFNMYPFAGCIAIAIYWFAQRNAEPEKVEQIREAFQFQATYVATFICMMGAFTIFNIHGFEWTVLVTWLVLTVAAIVVAARKGSFHYPLTLRFLDLINQRQTKNS